MMRRVAVQVTVFLLLGSIVSVAVAWAISWRGVVVAPVDENAAAAPTAFGDDGLVVESWWIERWEGFGTTAFISGRFRSPPMPRSDFAGENHPLDVLPRWADFDPPAEKFLAGEWEGDDRAVMLRGWPRRAMGCTFRMDHQTGGFSASMAIDLGPPGPFQLEPRLLPLRPLWPGLLINAAFYGAILWVLAATPFVGRGMIRRWRGQCAACGYPIGVSPRCTECGAAVDADSSATH